MSDDLGSDFFCTIFEIVKIGSGHDALRPLSSFAIQVKSSTDEISMDNKIDYLQRLELPFFIGVVSQSSATLTIYSAELLPLLFATFGLEEKLSLLPVQHPGINASHIYDDLRQQGRGIRLLCPFLATFSTSDQRSALVERVDALHKICVRAQSNIAARVSEEHIYDTDGRGSFQIISGPGSAGHFRMNLLKRLGEAFRNLDWIRDHGLAANTWHAEFECYEALYQSISNLGAGIMPAVVAVPYQELRQKLDRAG